ncbi:hypothetical protein D3C72_2016850 [compost metagenome]
MNSEVLAHECAWASNLSATSLAHENFASADFLTTEALYAKALTGVIVDVFT